MKNISISRIPVLLKMAGFFLLMSVGSCEKEGSGSDINISKEKISGYVQKGPYIIGTSITLSELRENLSQTGKTFSASISNNLGSFEIRNIELSSRYVEIKANGFYFNEVAGENSSAQLTLSALSDIKDRSSLNVNILSHLEKDRLVQLVSEGLSFAEAKAQAQAEVLAVFQIIKGDMGESESLNIAEEGEDNAILLAISLIIQGYLDVADMSELIGKMSADLKEDGTLNDPSTGTVLINNARLLNLPEIRENLEARFEEQNMDADIPNFEHYVQFFSDSSKFEFTDFIEYPETSDYGQNILYMGTDTFITETNLSMAADLPMGTSLQIIMKGGMWGIRVAPMGPVNWIFSHYDHTGQSQVFTATQPGERSDLNISFDLPIKDKITLEYYENDAVTPTRIREITILEIYDPAAGIFVYPTNGQFGPNILSMPSDTILAAGTKYSLAIQLPDDKVYNVGFNIEINTNGGSYTIDPEEMEFWTISYSDTSRLEISTTGTDITADMSILFEGSGNGKIERDGYQKIFWWE